VFTTLLVYDHERTDGQTQALATRKRNAFGG